jgi:hypothetical protein
MNNNITSLTHIDKELVGKFRLLIKGTVMCFCDIVFTDSLCYIFTESNINLSMSDELLMCFIHARKYDVNRAMRLVKL